MAPCRASQIGLERVAMFDSFGLGLKDGEVVAIKPLVLDAKSVAPVACLDVLRYGRCVRERASSAATFRGSGGSF